MNQPEPGGCVPLAALVRAVRNMLRRAQAVKHFVQRATAVCIAKCDVSIVGPCTRRRLFEISGLG